MTNGAFLIALSLGLVLSPCLGEDAQKPLLTDRVGPDPARHVSGDIPFVTEDLEAFIEAKMKQWHCPGLAIGIIDGNQTWFKGFGYADLSTSKPVTPDTLFYCGSTTKSFTSAALSLLIDPSAANTSTPLAEPFASSPTPLEWTTPISALLREDFVLSSRWATDHVTLLDAASHRTGYPRHDLSMNVPSARHLARNLRHLPMAAEPRTRFLYSNIMYGVLGHVVSVLSGRPLVAFLRDHLWKPWGMGSTFLGLADVRAAGRAADFAAEYWFLNDSAAFAALPHADLIADAGAGAIISNVRDYARYLAAMMRQAGPVSKAGHALLKAPHNVVVPADGPWTGPVWYGAGWEAGVVRDEVVYFHGGQVNAFTANMLMVPGREFAIVTMLNAASLAQEVVVWKVLYDFLGVNEGERFDFEARGKLQENARDGFLAACPRVLYPSAPSPPLPAPLPLANFTGTYVDAGYGAITLYLNCTHAALPPDSAAHPTRDDDGCVLATKSNADEAVTGLTMHVLFEHVTGDFWVGWAYIDQLTRAGHLRPEACLRAQFRVDERGEVAGFGFDVRLEEIDGPLVWFERVKAGRKAARGVGEAKLHNLLRR